jgi:hypothetical protein
LWNQGTIGVGIKITVGAFTQTKGNMDIKTSQYVIAHFGLTRRMARSAKVNFLFQKYLILQRMSRCLLGDDFINGYH